MKLVNKPPLYHYEAGYDGDAPLCKRTDGTKESVTYCKMGQVQAGRGWRKDVDLGDGKGSSEALWAWL